MPRKPRDIEAELKALQEKARSLRSRQKTQYGELVLATGADALSIEEIAGVLLASLDQAKSNSQAKEGWRRRGEAFFQRAGNGAGKTNGAKAPSLHDSNGAAATASGVAAE
jgi:chromosome segregation and condensation protein ScpB